MEPEVVHFQECRLQSCVFSIEISSWEKNCDCDEKRLWIKFSSICCVCFITWPTDQWTITFCSRCSKSRLQKQIQWRDNLLLQYKAQYLSPRSRNKWWKCFWPKLPLNRQTNLIEWILPFFFHVIGFMVFFLNMLNKFFCRTRHVPLPSPTGLPCSFWKRCSISPWLSTFLIII